MHINFLCSLDHVPFQGKTVLDSIFGDDIGLLGYRAVPPAQQPHETEEVNEFLEEERVKSGANALMTTNSSLLTIQVLFFKQKSEFDEDEDSCSIISYRALHYSSTGE